MQDRGGWSGIEAVGLPGGLTPRFPPAKPVQQQGEIDPARRFPFAFR